MAVKPKYFNYRREGRSLGFYADEIIFNDEFGPAATNLQPSTEIKPIRGEIFRYESNQLSLQFQKINNFEESAMQMSSFRRAYLRNLATSRISPSALGFF